MLKKILFSFLFVMLTATVAFSSQTLPTLVYPPAHEFVIRTCIDFDIDNISVRKALAEEYERQLSQYKNKSKKHCIEALDLALDWCRYWRDSSPRRLLTPGWITRASKAECFFRALQPRE